MSKEKLPPCPICGSKDSWHYWKETMPAPEIERPIMDIKEARKIIRDIAQGGGIISAYEGPLTIIAVDGGGAFHTDIEVLQALCVIHESEAADGK